MTKTDQRLIEAAAALLDSGGEEALTLRAVGQAAGVSHNAPYKHFANRNALLAAVATVDFAEMGKAFRAAAQSAAPPRQKLVDALKSVSAFSEQHPARYRLLFSEPALAESDSAELKASAGGAFGAFLGIVDECQAARAFPDIPSSTIAGLLFASIHGLNSMKSSGRLRAEKGFASVESSIELLVDLISRK